MVECLGVGKHCANGPGLPKVEGGIRDRADFSGRDQLVVDGGVVARVNLKMLAHDVARALTGKVKYA